MAVPAFGFSVGDFIAGIRLIKDLIASLDEVTGAKPHFRHLIAELRNLEWTLTEVKALQVDASQTSQKLALEQVASQCQDCIETFLKRNTKIHNALNSQSTVSTWHANLRKFQWAICRQDEVDKFRAEIKGHVLTINTLLATIQLASTSLQNETSVKHHQESNEIRSLVKKNNEILNSQADLIVTISQAVTSCVTQQQTQNLQIIMQKVLETNMKIFQLVLKMQEVQQTQIPLQINRQQPVYFEDAHGRLAPFHIEFINSLEAFQAVMEVRFRHVPGLKKVLGNQYILKESNSKRRLNLQAPWEAVFLPGRKVVMSMIFQMPQTTTTSCPGCQSENEDSSNASQGEVQCVNPDCGLWYERISDASHQSEKRSTGDTPEPPATGTRLHDPLGDESDDEDTVQQFRRVQVVLKQQSILQMIPNTNTSPHSTVTPMSDQLSESTRQNSPLDLIVAPHEVDTTAAISSNDSSNGKERMKMGEFERETHKKDDKVILEDKNESIHAIRDTRSKHETDQKLHGVDKAKRLVVTHENGATEPLNGIKSLRQRKPPALAYQFGNTIIVEDEDGNVIKKYKIPSETTKNSRLGTQRGQSIADRAIQSLKRMGAHISLPTNKAPGLSVTEDDVDLRFTVSAGGRRMTKEEFIQQMNQMNPKDRVKSVQNSDAPESVKSESGTLL